MSTNSIGYLSYPDLKRYAQFLFIHHLDDIAAEYLTLAQKSNLPILKLLSGLSAEKLLQLSKKDMTEFVEAIKDGAAEEEILKTVAQWKSNKLEVVGKNEISGSDLILIYSIRKRCFIKFLSSYIKDGEQIIELINQLEELFSALELIAINAFVEIQQEEMKIDQELTESIIEHSVDGILGFDTEYRCTIWNRNMAIANKMTKEEVMGKNILELFPMYASSEDKKAMERVLKGEKVFISERPYLIKSGYFEINMIPLYGKDHKVIGGISFVHDVTERKQAEDVLKSYHNELMNANEELTLANKELRAIHYDLTLSNKELRESQEKLGRLNDELTESLETIGKMHETLLLTQRNLLEAQEIAKLGSWELDLHKNKISCSDQMYRLLGYEPEELEMTLETYLSFVYEDDQSKVREIFNTHRNQTPYSVEYRILKKDGSIRWVNARGRVVVNSGKDTTKMGGVVYDITEQKLAQEEIIQSRDYYLTILDDFPALIWRSDVDGNCDYFNKTWLEYTGRQLEQELGKGFTDMIHPEDFIEVDRFFKENMHSPNAFKLEYRLKRYDGQYRWMVDFGKPLYNLHGDFIGFIGACYDIHDQKEKQQELNIAYYSLKEVNEELMRTEELLTETNRELENRVQIRTHELEEKNSELIKINQDLDNFVYTASHDLRAPIANLELLISTLHKKLKPNLDDSLVKIFEMISTSINKFNKTIKDLTEITQVQKDLSDLPEAISFKEVLEDVKLDVAKLITESGARIVENFKVSELVYAKKNLRSILYNFLSNALKYRSKSKQCLIEFSTTSYDGYTVLTVRDNGLGIGKEQQQKMFTMFKRFHNHVEGTGIGLYIVKRIIENNGGQIEVESELNEGTTFKVSFKNPKVGFANLSSRHHY